MKDMKKILTICIIVTIIVMVSLIIIICKLNNKKDIGKVFKEANKVSNISKRSDYFNIKNCMETYRVYSKENPDLLINIIPDFVMSKINSAEISIKDIELPSKITRIDRIYVSKQTISEKAYEETTNINAYIVNGVLIDENNLNKEDFNIIVLLDEVNSTFNIIPQKYIQQENINLENGKNLEIFKDNNIRKNNYNMFKYSDATEKDMGEEYFNRIMISMKYDPEYAYNMLDKEYRNQNFSNYETFKGYIENNKEVLNNATCSYCDFEYNTGKVKYTCNDIKGNVYYFNQESPLVFTWTLNKNSN